MELDQEIKQIDRKITMVQNDLNGLLTPIRYIVLRTLNHMNAMDSRALGVSEIKRLVWTKYGYKFSMAMIYSVIKVLKTNDMIVVSTKALAKKHSYRYLRTEKGDLMITRTEKFYGNDSGKIGHGADVR